jgi:hypothetical protein
MPTDPPPPSSVRIVARTPLLRSGLERLVARAGAVATDRAGASLTVRTADSASTDPDLEIILDDDRVTIAVQRVPDAATWATAHRLLRVLIPD